MHAYLDHAATTPMASEAVEAMMPFLTGRFGNPAGGHRESRWARRAVDDAREQIAALLGADFSEVVFTSGGTEADNLAVVGGWESAAATRDSPPAMVCSAMEHHAVLHTCRALARRTGAELTEVPTAGDGTVDLAALAEACTPEVGLVSVMTVNNEIGTRQPVEAVARLVRDRSPSALFHTDAVQAVVWTDVGAQTAPADLVAVSAHKFGGPQGTGALVVRAGVPIGPLIHGGGQERDRRSGTPNVAGIVAMAAALTVAHAGRPETVTRVAGLRDRLADGLLASVTGATETAAREHRVAGHLHLRFAGLEQEALVILLDQAGVSVSAGAACASGAVEPSHVLVSMGLRPEEAAGAIRFSLGPTTTCAEIDHALAVVPAAVAQLRD
ncbi:MAG TPA: cysteine desulfurase family protein [Acidimicrobiales bacterium]|nr:cysteine desulfurase family protein [Acidimicrobiales bacterium]